MRRGEMAEWLKARASKACIPLRVSGVRIPLSPPDFLRDRDAGLRIANLRKRCTARSSSIHMLRRATLDGSGTIIVGNRA